MIIIMKSKATLKEVSQILQEIKRLGLKSYMSKGEDRSIIGLVGNKVKVLPDQFETFPGVDKVVSISEPYKLAGREFKAEKSVFQIRGTSIGGNNVVVIAGPCAIESREQIMETAWAVQESGARFLRGGAFKPRTSPYSFHGLKEKGLELLHEVKEKTGLLVVTEVIAPEHVALVGQVADVFQIGTRNMQNFTLLEEVGKSDKPVLLKRGMMATLEELLMAAEYILSNGNSRVILCERGIRTFARYTRNTLDLAAVPLLHQLTHLPVCVDPSHGTGMSSLVLPVSRAAVAVGADALLIEVHPRPEEALSDGNQSLNLQEYGRLMQELAPVAGSINRSL